MGIERESLLGSPKREKGSLWGVGLHVELNDAVFIKGNKENGKGNWERG